MAHGRLLVDAHRGAACQTSGAELACAEALRLGATIAAEGCTMPIAAAARLADTHDGVHLLRTAARALSLHVACRQTCRRALWGRTVEIRTRPLTTEENGALDALPPSTLATTPLPSRALPPGVTALDVVARTISEEVLIGRDDPLLPLPPLAPAAATASAAGAVAVPSPKSGAAGNATAGGPLAPSTRPASPAMQPPGAAAASAAIGMMATPSTSLSTGSMGGLLSAGGSAAAASPPHSPAQAALAAAAESLRVRRSVWSGLLDLRGIARRFGQRGVTALHAAVMAAAPGGVITALLDAGADANAAQAISGVSPLMSALLSNNTEVRLLPCHRLTHCARTYTCFRLRLRRVCHLSCVVAPW